MNKKRMIIITVILVLGIGVSAFAYISMLNQKQHAMETKQIMVLNRDIRPYETIVANDLKTVDVLKSQELTGYLTDRYDLVGKVAADYMVADEPVKEDLVVDKSSIRHIKFVTLKTDYTRSGGAKIGDVVDIYKVIPATKEFPTETILLGENAIVISVTDSEGTSTTQAQSASLTAPLAGGEKKIPVQALKLAVDSRAIDVKKIVEGSVDGNQYVMVVKNTDSGKLAIGGK